MKLLAAFAISSLNWEQVVAVARAPYDLGYIALYERDLLSMCVKSYAQITQQMGVSMLGGVLLGMACLITFRAFRFARGKLSTLHLPS